MSKITSVIAALALATSVSGCMQVNPSVAGAATGAALGGTAAVIAGGSRTDVAASALAGSLIGAAIPVQ
jgi:hypothetical protein